MDIDDFIPQTLNESLNEWCVRLVNILTPRIIENLWILLEEARSTAANSKQLDKYVLSFQQLLLFVPKWNASQVEEMRKHIVQKSGCGYLEELVTCAHIILTKALVCARPGNRQKQLNVSIPKLDTFIHRAFIKSAGHAYRNAYLFEKEVSELKYKRNMHDLEVLVHRAILDAVRENIPEEEIIRAFLDENYEFEEEVVIEHVGGAGDSAPVTVSAPVSESSTSNINTNTNTSGTADEDAPRPFVEDVEGTVVTRVNIDENGPLSSIGSGAGSSPTISKIEVPEFVPKTVQQLSTASDSAVFASKVIQDDATILEDFKLPDFLSEPATSYSNDTGASTGGSNDFDLSLDLGIEDI
jgi:hypothetical protein